MYKRKMSFLILLSLLMAITAPVTAVSGQSVGIRIDGSDVNFTAESGVPFIDSASRTQVPLRVTMETFGCTVDWNDATKTASVSRYGRIVEVPIGQNCIYCNGMKISTDTAAQIVDNRTYLPIRAVLEAFGAAVDWDSVNYYVIVSRNSNSAVSGGSESSGTPVVTGSAVSDGSGNSGNPVVTGSAVSGDSGASESQVVTGSAVSGGSSSSVSEETATSFSYIGNVNSKIFHKSTCPSVKRMNEGNKVKFDSRSDAIAQGYTPCDNCNP